MNRGILITFEGGEGAGKSTQLALLAEDLIASGEKVLSLREPGGTEVGEKIRSIVKDKDFQHPPTAEVELLLFLASRTQLIGERILPALQRGYIVLCDRFSDSTIAYQCGGRGLTLETVLALNKFASGGITPDITILLDVSPRKGLNRISAGRSGDMDRLEGESLEFFYRVRKSYGRIAMENPARVYQVDGSDPLDAVKGKIRRIVVDRIHLLRSDINRSMSGTAN